MRFHHTAQQLFNFYKLLSQILLTDMTCLLRMSRHAWCHFVDKHNVKRVEKWYGAKGIMTECRGRNESLASTKRLLHQIDGSCVCWLDFGWFEFNFWPTLRCILQKRHTIAWNTCGYPCVKLYLIRWSSTRGIAKSLGAHFFCTHCMLSSPVWKSYDQQLWMSITQIHTFW